MPSIAERPSRHPDDIELQIVRQVSADMNAAAAHVLERVRASRMRSAELREQSRLRRLGSTVTAPYDRTALVAGEGSGGSTAVDVARSEMRAALTTTDLEAARAAVCAAVGAALLDSGFADEVVIQRHAPGGDLVVEFATSPIGRRLVEVQQGSGDVPALSAEDQGSGRANERLTSWAESEGFRRTLSLTLDSSKGAVGTLYAFARDAVWSWQQLAEVRAVAAEAAVSLAVIRDKENLWTAIEARHRIGISQGMLMTRFGISADQSYALLLRLSQDQQLKISVIAQRVIADGGLRDVS
ncbi:ANTAR domain-containing protein [Nakamurella sp. YIM 132087]|uniref:ANTAR domain-containing protein n=1 Tax=Nakamurella alba TaxID=2665158 RepID=A0A7K1FKH6_9ACTN|nr:ANTAR domain-containing protein [Nakamurella alba]MTD14645.1 ANTAR domain-containing protein [Nakamurella alba]